MKTFSTALVAVGFAAQFAQAWNSNASPFNVPSNSNNKCSSQQQSGFNWDSHPAGNPSNIGDFSFHNCQVKSAAGKRDTLGRRTNGNCIAGHADHSGGPGMKCQSHGFAVHECHISTDQDKQPIEVHYHMPDNTVCKAQHTCGKDVTTIKNEQCGGATSMSIAVPTHAPTQSCSVSIHSVNFHCGTASYTPTVTPHTETKSTPTSSPKTTPHSESPKTTPNSESPKTTPHSESPKTTPSTTSSSTSSSSTSTPKSESPKTPSSTPSSESPKTPSSTPSSESPKTPSSTPSSESPKTPSSTPSSESPKTPSTTPTNGGNSPVTPTPNKPVFPTNGTSTAHPTNSTGPTTYTTSTTCPPGYVVTPSGGKPTTLTTPSVSTYVATSTPGAPAPSNGTTPSSPAQPTQQAPAPDVLPRCLNTFESKCKSNTDADCYCKDNEFITKAIQCAASHSESDEEAAHAISYLQGICAPHIAQNPAIITACPSHITPAPPAATPAPEAPKESPASPAKPNSPAAPAAPSTCETPMTTIPFTSGSISTTITAPQVTFASTGSNPGLYPAAPATPTPAAPAPASPSAPAPAAPAPASPSSPSSAAPASPAQPSSAAPQSPAQPSAPAQPNSPQAPSSVAPNAPPRYPTGNSPASPASGTAASTGLTSYPTGSGNNSPVSYNPANGAGKIAASGAVAVMAGAVAALLI